MTQSSLGIDIGYREAFKKIAANKGVSMKSLLHKWIADGCFLRSDKIAVIGNESP